MSAGRLAKKKGQFGLACPRIALDAAKWTSLALILALVSCSLPHHLDDAGHDRWLGFGGFLRRLGHSSANVADRTPSASKCRPRVYRNYFWAWIGICRKILQRRLAKLATAARKTVVGDQAIHAEQIELEICAWFESTIVCAALVSQPVRVSKNQTETIECRAHRFCHGGSPESGYMNQGRNCVSGIQSSCLYTFRPTRSCSRMPGIMHLFLRSI
jgi:hypothetical protein